MSSPRQNIVDKIINEYLRIKKDTGIEISSMTNKDEPCNIDEWIAYYPYMFNSAEIRQEQPPQAKCESHIPRHLQTDYARFFYEANIKNKLKPIEFEQFCNMELSKPKSF